MARLWGLHDLQIIASKLHQALYRPTAGLFEGTDAGPQSYQSVMRDPAKWGEMANISARLFRLPHDQVTPTDLEDRRRLYGFITGTEFKALAQELGLELGFTADDLDKIANDKLSNNPKLAKVFRSIGIAGKVAGQEIASDMKAKWIDPAPVGISRPKSLAHSSAAAVRYGLEEPAALAYAITAFIDLSAQLPEMIERCIAKEPVFAAPRRMGLHIGSGDNRVTFELMFAAYRVIFLRDQNCLREEVVGFMKKTTSFNIFASEQAKPVRQDFLMGANASVNARLGEPEESLNALHGTDPGNITRYGANSLRKVLAVLKRDHEDGYNVYNPELTPAFAWRLSK